MAEPRNEQTQPIRSKKNVFKAMGFLNADKQLEKVGLAYQINQTLKKHKLPYVEVCQLLKLHPSKRAALKRGCLDPFSVEELKALLSKANASVIAQLSATVLVAEEAGMEC
jgi:predicted XRE-type DNA-binding protein